MKKLLSLLLTLFMSIGMFASEITFEPGTVNGTTTGQEADAMTFEGVTFSSTSAALGRTDNYRFYASSTTTVSSNVGNITKIVFTCNSPTYASTLGNAIFSNGSVTVSNNNVTWIGDIASFTFKPSAQVRVDLIVVTVNDGSASPTYYVLSLPENLEGGTVTVNVSNPAQVSEGTQVTVTATPSSGYELDWMKANDVEVENPYSFNMNEDVTITAAFKEHVITGTYYQKVTTTSDLEDGSYLIVYETGSLAFNGGLETLDAVNNYISVTIDGDIIIADDNVDAARFNIINNTILSASGFYIGRTASGNGLNQSAENNLTNTITITNAGYANIVSQYDTYLKFNSASNQMRFRYYGSGQQSITLYKRTEMLPIEGATIPEISTVAEYKALNENATFKFINDVVCVQNYDDNGNRYLYVVDETGEGMVIFKPKGDVASTYITCDIIPGGWTATKSFYNNLPEAKNAEGFIASERTTNIEPIVITIDEINPNMYGDWVIIKNVLIREEPTREANGPSIQSGNYYITDGGDPENKLAIYATHIQDFNLPDDWESDTRYDIVGVIGVFGENNQIYPTGIEKDNQTITSISEVNNEVKSVKYYDLIGRSQSVPFDGVNIVTIEFTNGTKKVNKIIKR